MVGTLCFAHPTICNRFSTAELTFRQPIAAGSILGNLPRNTRHREARKSLPRLMEMHN
jgi:hypothetical protein